MPDTIYNERRVDDLDLTELLKNFVRFVKSSGKIIFLFGLIGLLLAVILYLLLPNQYASKSVLHSFVLTNQENIQIVNGWNDLLKNKEYPTLAQTLGVSPRMLQSVSKITADEIVRVNPDGNLNGFIVIVHVEDTTILDELQGAIIFGLENSDYVKERLAVKRASLTTLINRVSDEIRKLDSIKVTVENALQNRGPGSSSSFLISAGGINNEIIVLNEKLLNYKEELKFAGAVHVLQKFNRLSRPVSPKKTTLFGLGLLTGIVIGYLAYLWLYIKRKILTEPVQNGINKPITA